MSARERKLAYVAWVIVCVVWGTTYLANHVALESLPFALLAGFRWTAAGVILMLALRVFGVGLPPRDTWKAIAIVGLLMNVIGNGILVWAQQYVPSGLTAVVVATVPFWTVGMEAFIGGGERLTRRTLIGFLLGFAGIVVLVWPSLTLGDSGGRMFVLGVLVLQLAGVAWAYGTSYTKRHSIGDTPMASSALQMVFSGVTLMIIGTVLGEWNQVAFTTRTFAALAYLTIAGSVVAYTAYVYALKYLPISTVSLYAYVNPVIAVILGTVVLNEPFSAHLVVAATLVLSGIAIVRSAPKPKLLAPVALKAVA
jgi:drug/metabolite transporter (DMT)-like permease